MVIRKEKEAKRKENRPDGKEENAMKPRFPLSHRARYQRPKEEPPGTTHQRRGLTTASIIRRATCASFIQPARGGIFR
jgi:hypothetical protein